MTEPSDRDHTVLLDDKATLLGLEEQRRDLEHRVECLLADTDPRHSDPKEFLAARFDAGLAWVSFPIGRGGQAYDPSLQSLVESLFTDAGSASPADIAPLGYATAGPVIMAEGTDQQKDQFLRSTFSGDSIWCQLFSEPGAGSDLASVSTTAVRDGDVWVVNGQKVWTSMAHLADYALLLANTSREETKHHNLSYFIVDMRQPGVDVRPLIQMTGTAEFNEVFLTDVEVDDANRLGNVNDGWRVARLTLSSERLTQGVGYAYEVGPVLERAIDRYRISTERDDNLTSHLRRGQLVELWVRDRVLRHLQLWTLAGSHQLRDCAPAALKILKSELFKDVTNFSVSAAGPEGMLYPGGYRFERSKSIMEFENDQQFFLRCRARSIGGGTSEVLRNMVAERVLSLPR